MNDVAKLGRFIIMQYELVNDYEIDFDFSLQTVELIKKALDSVGGDMVILKNQLDKYIKNKDYTGYLNKYGSENRERSLAIEGCLETFGAWV